MHILIASDNLLVPSSGYSNHVRLLGRSLIDEGIGVTVHSMTYDGRPHQVDGLDMVGGPPEMLPAHVSRIKPDFVLLVKDPYIFPPSFLGSIGCPVFSIVPVDTEPVGQALADSLHGIAGLITLTQFSQVQLEEIGIPSVYCPMGVNTQFFQPDRVPPLVRSNVRRELNLPSDAFIFTFVGANNSIPSRKNIDQILMAWSTYSSTNPRAVLVLNTEVDVSPNIGISVKQFIGQHRWAESSYRIIDQYDRLNGLFTHEKLRDLYRASDVLLAPSSGEGFCLPVVEAQACGCPVIASDFTALRETAQAGWKIPAREDPNYGELVYSKFGAYRFRVSQRALVAYFTEAFDILSDIEKRDAMSVAARQAGLNYHWGKVFDDHWLPALQNFYDAVVNGKIDSWGDDEK